MFKMTICVAVPSNLPFQILCWKEFWHFKMLPLMQIMTMINAIIYKNYVNFIIVVIGENDSDCGG